MSPAGAAIAASVGPTVGAFDSTVRGLLGTPAAPAPPPPPQPRPLPAAVGATGTPATMPLGAGADPRMALMGQAMGRTGQLPGVGLPVALGGAGWGWDPRQAALDMLGDGSDPSWAAAVARAYGRPL
jgi:hypothetical protein